MNQKQMWQIAHESSIVNPVRSVPVNLDAQQQCAKLLNFNHRKESESTICPWYSRRQLRTIRRFRIKQTKYGRGSIKKLSPNIAFDTKRRSGHNIRGIFRHFKILKINTGKRTTKENTILTIGNKRTTRLQSSYLNQAILRTQPKRETQSYW